MDSKDTKMVYFASPFFNPEQVEREERLKAKLRELGFYVWSPKESFFCPPDADDNMRSHAFEGNINAIRDCDVIFVVTDGKDMGTIWEAGFAYGIKTLRTKIFGYSNCQSSKPTVVYYCETLPAGGAFNLMLAQSGDIIITDFRDLEKLPVWIESGERIGYAGDIE